jgi:predicted ATPase
MAAVAKPRLEDLFETEARAQVVVLTGGPCAGKTTAVSEIRTYCEARGVRVFFVPEAATLFFSNGSRGDTDLRTPSQREAFQIAIMRTQMHLEDTFRALAAATGEQCVILCDRGTMDGRAYCSDAEWNTVLAAGGFASNVELRDSRYDAVLHLVTAADGATNFYKQIDGVRLETPELACELDAKTLASWSDHPRVFVFRNEAVGGEHGAISFAEKMRRVCLRLARLLGIATDADTTPRASEATRAPLVRRKWSIGLLDISQLDAACVAYTSFEICKVYLECAGGEGPERIEAARRCQTPLGGGEGSEDSAAGSPQELKVEDAATVEAAATLAAMPYCCVRSRTRDGATAYNMTRFQMVETTAGGELKGSETKRILSKREFAQHLATNRDFARRTVRLTRTTIVYEKHFYKIDEYLEPKEYRGLKILSAELPEGKPLEPEIARLLGVTPANEVTGDVRYRAVYVSLRS